MDRRRFLATAAIPVGVTTAGCSFGADRTVELEAEIEQQDGRRENETYLVYRDDGEEVRVVGFDQHSFPASLNDRFGFGIFIEYDEATSVESFRFDLRTQPAEEPADIYLASPPGAVWPNLRYGRVEGDGSTRIALSDAPDVTDETVFINTIIDPNTAPAERIAVDLELELTASDAPVTYRTETATTFEPETR
ncbi:hypothetical protein [Halorussus halobius]|uniref:hypothetical protein n=1 Tax=Halorussus halobius TaxID=1710537 RepID=UPI001092673B|nr:hypothetical protein [Halorussus halobius]